MKHQTSLSAVADATNSRLAKVSPTPWRVTFDGVVDANGKRVARDIHVETATELVLCVNSHAALVEALKVALRQWRSYYMDQNEDSLEIANHAEGNIYRMAEAALRAGEQA